jgi:hypothetical protein
MNLLYLKKKMVKLKARSYASLILGLVYGVVTYFFIQPIEAHLTYQKYILAALICIAAWSSQRWAQYDKIYKQNKRKEKECKR